MAKKPSLTRKFEAPFILTGTKLNKINELVEKRIDLIRGEEEIEKIYTVTLDKGRKHVLTKIESVLELDNSLNNKIIELSIEWEIGKEENETRNFIFINFDSDVSAILNTSILIAGKADDASWLNETIAEVEEQVERTIPKDIIYKIKTLPYSSVLSALMISAICMSAALAFVMNNIEDDNAWLSDKNRQELIKMTKNVSSTNDKVDFIYSAVSRSIKEKNNNKFNIIIRKPSTYFILTPILIIAFTFYYLYSRCYPSYVFEWGDFGQYHQRIIERRKYLWSLIIGSLIIGILANLFVFGLSESIVNSNR